MMDCEGLIECSFFEQYKSEIEASIHRPKRPVETGWPQVRLRRSRMERRLAERRLVEKRLVERQS